MSRLTGLWLQELEATHQECCDEHHSQKPLLSFHLVFISFVVCSPESGTNPLSNLLKKRLTGAFFIASSSESIP